MSNCFPSEQWARALARELETSSDYADAAGSWAPGQLALVVAPAGDQPGDQAGDQGSAILLTLTAGACEGVVAVPTKDALASARIVIQASAEVWRSLLLGERDPVKALMGGDVKVAKGALATVVGQVFAYAALMKAASRVGEAP